MVGRTVAACRQLASRARKRVQEEAGSSRFAIDPAEQRRVVDAFIAACAGGDIQALLPLLDPSVMGWADMGGRLPAVSQPNVGSEMVGSRLMKFFGAGSGLQLVAKVINGEPSVVALLEDRVVAVLALSVTDHLISRVYVVSDERKLAHVKRVLELQSS
jgi:RNA polymerase sigma-70 factor (ECF subfamily)